MPDGESQRRLGALEARGDVADERWEDVKQYMIRQGGTMIDIKSSIAVIINNQNDSKDYQKQCNTDRGDFEKRITRVEGFQSRQIKYATASGGFMGFLVIGGAKLIEKLAVFFNG